jgi:hypothetical protein
MMKMNQYYLLDDDHNIIESNDVHEWGRMFEQRERIVKQEHFNGTFISTVFLGLDHSFSEEGPPVLFETMVFNPEGSGYYEERCCTWDEAVAQHAAVYAKVAAGEITDDS